MPAKVSLKAIVEALEMQGQDSLSFVNVETGEVETLSRELPGMAEESEEEDDGYTEGECPEGDLAVKIVSSKDYERLPTNYAFRDAALREIAKDWCRENGVEWK